MRNIARFWRRGRQPLAGSWENASRENPSRRGHVLTSASLLGAIGRRLRDVFPEGHGLPDRVWRERHRVILVLLWIHAAAIAVFGIARGFTVAHTLFEAAVVAAAAALAGRRAGSHRLRSATACFGLMTASAFLVHLSGGYIELHFHFFVMVGLMAVYQDWITFLLAVGYVVVHHGLVGVLQPTSVYNHAAAWAHPWLWAGIHGGFILAMSLVSLFTWRVNERAHALTQLVLDSTGEGIVGVDTDGRATFVNAAAVRLLERSRDELIGQPLGPLVLDPPDPESAACRLYASLGTDGSPIEDTFRTPDGRPFPVEYVSSEIRQRGQRAGAVVVFKDTSRRKTAQEALRLSEAQLRQAQKMEAIGQLAGGIAHDFNNLLSVIIGRSQLLTRQVKSPLREAVDLITTTALRAATLTNQLLVFSRQQVLEPQVLSLVELVDGMAAMLRRLIGEHIALTTTAAPVVHLVYADAAQLQQVILNLVVNARDAMLPGGGSLTIEVANAAGAEPSVMLAVTDTGGGIDEATRARMFEPFFTTKAGRGSGLGLAVVYGIVKRHGGAIAVDSAPGQGATFRIFLPGADGVAATHRNGTARGSVSGHETIMVVEDDDHVRALARDVLRRHRYTVLEARSSDDAVRLAASAQPIHLLLTDVVMPGMNGQLLARQLQSARPGLRVLYMSGYPGETIATHGVLNGGAQVLPKPFTVRQLTEAVRAVLDHAAAP